MSSNSSTYGPDVIAPDGRIISSPFYEYLPTEWVGILFVVLFSITTILHLGQTFYYKMWFLLPTACLAGFGEIIGWSGRVWSSINPLLQTPFLIQIIATILAPTPFLAALFILFARITNRLGVRYSRLSPQWYSRIFFTCDFVSLVVQGLGGGLAASANDQAGSNLGAHIMLGGIIFQLVSLVVFIALAVEYIVRYAKDLPIRQPSAWSSDATLAHRADWDKKLKMFIGGLTFITTCILIRSIYRLNELADGWNGRIITTQVYFNVLDGAMVFLAIFTLNVFHPGYFLGQPVDMPFAFEKSKTLGTVETLPVAV